MTITESMDTEVAIIGAGVVGLAMAAELASSFSVIVLESHAKFGQETSSRNSEVIHSGIYYPKASKKTEWCIRGRELLYDFCNAHGVSHARCGKILISRGDGDVEYLTRLSSHCRDLGVTSVMLTSSQVKDREPKIQSAGGVFFPDSGIVDSHELMAALERLFLSRGGTLAYRHRVNHVKKVGNEWVVTAVSDGKSSELRCGAVVNAAGLGAAELSNRTLGGRRYEHRYCRGRYFALGGRFRHQFHHLVYPVPEKDGLGVHVTIDTGGNARLGPDVDWCAASLYEGHERWYDCDWEALRPSFVKAVLKYCPEIRPEDLSPGLIGIRPKLFIDGSAQADFLVENHGRFVHCLGIESPGLTASLAIAQEVKRLLGRS